MITTCSKTPSRRCRWVLFVTCVVALVRSIAPSAEAIASADRSVGRADEPMPTGAHCELSRAAPRDISDSLGPRGQTGGALHECVPGQMIVGLSVGKAAHRPEAMEAELNAAEEVLPGIVLRRFSLRPGQRTVLVQLRDGLTVRDAVKETIALKDARIVYAEPNHIVSIDETTPNDPSFPLQWALHNTGQTGGTADADINAPEAWDVFTGSSDVIVAVIDTGVDYEHPDLAPNIWANPGESGGGKENNGIDDDGNGYVDDVHGYDFALDDPDPMDAYGHGTHVAGTIAAAGNNSLGVVGVNWSSCIMCLRFMKASGSGGSFDAAEAVNYATLMGASVTNNSWGGGGFNQTLLDAITAAGDAGVLFVAAAGNSARDNDATPHYPSSYQAENIVAVASTDHDDDLASYSNWGATSVDLAAPGSSVLSTAPPFVTLFYESFSSVTPPSVGPQLTLEGPNNFWGTIETGDGNIALRGDAAQSSPYRPNAGGAVVTPPMDTRGLPGLSLSFRYRYEMEDFVDALIIEAWDGTAWNETFRRGSSCCLHDYYYSTAVDLEPYRNEAMRVRFRWITDADNNDYYGAEVDSITIRHIGTDYASAGYAHKNGTSMASPHVAGAAAFLLGRNPDLPLDVLKARLLEVDVLSSVSGKVVSNGRLNLFRAATSGPCVVASPEQIDNTTPSGQDASTQSFTICSSTTETVTFTIVDDADWLECAPTSGNAGSGGQCAEITVNYTTADLPVDEHLATITVSAPEAVISPVGLPVSLTVTSADCPCIYDLDGNCTVAGGDLGWFAGCWMCTDDSPCWAENNCADKDFDCNGSVAGGDLGWFAGAWLEDCDELDPAADYPSCRECEGPIVCPWPSSPGSAAALARTAATMDLAPQAPVELALRLSRDASQSSCTGLIRQPKLGTIWAGQHVFAEVWARDRAPGSQGLAAVFADVSFDPTQFVVVRVNTSDTFGLLANEAVGNDAGRTRRVGGATLEAGHGIGVWVRVATVELKALTTMTSAAVALKPSSGEAVSARGRGLVPRDRIRVSRFASESRTQAETVREPPGGAKLRDSG